MIGRIPGVRGLCGVVLLAHALTVLAATADNSAAQASLAAPENRVTVLQRGSRPTTFISADRARPIPVNSLSARPDARALAFLRDNRSLLVGSSLPLQLKTLRVDESDLVGINHVRVQQQHSGIPIRGAEAMVHLTDAGVTAVNSRLVSIDAAFNTTPAFSSVDSVQAARRLIVQQYGPVNATFSDPVLEIIDPAIYPITASTAVLSWFIEATGNALRERIWINAWTGAVVFNFSQLTDARNRLTYNAGNSSTLPATPARIEGQAATGDAEVDNAHDYAGDFYNYFLAIHGRDSYNSRGATIESVARACRQSLPCPMENAYWDGFRIYLGAGYGVDDVVAHELSHAVIEYSANLDYLNMSGALNESYADIFGEAIDLWNGRGTDTSNMRWLLGEDLARYRGVGLRHLYDPAARGQPARVSDTGYICDPRVDSGGVHINSGVPNHAFALMADGGTYNGYTINGIGIDKASAIQYRALTVYLQKTSQFIDNVNALIQACTDLIGATPVTHDDCSQVKKAVLAVEMTTSPCPRGATPPAPPPVAPAPLTAAAGQCPTGQVVLPVFADNFEDPVSGNWVTGAIDGANHWLGGTGVPAIYTTGKTAGGIYSLHGTAAGSAGDSYVQMNQDLMLPPQAQAYFESAYDLDAGFDGGVLEYSIDAGGTWADAGALFSAGRNYDGGLANGMNNPLGGRRAYTGHADTYAGTRVNLSALAGQNVRFRFRFATDRSVAAPGWWIDNFSVFTCLQVSPGIEITPLNGLITTELGGKATFTVRLKSPPTAPVMIGFSTSNAAEGAVAPASVTFSSANWNSLQSVTVTGVDDAIDDGDVIYTVLSANASSADPEFNGMDVPDVLVTNADNDGAGIAATPASGLLTNESGASASFTLKLQTQPVADVTINLSVDKPDEVVLSTLSLTFNATNWNTPRTVYVSGVDDPTIDPATPFAISLVVISKDPKYFSLTTPVITGTNADNDFAGAVVMPDTGLTTSELGTTAAFTIRLKTAPQSSVTIGLNSDNVAEGTVLPSAVVFDSVNWNTPQTVAIVGVNDATADGNVTYRIITAAASSQDTNYNGLSIPDVTVTNIDDEQPNIIIEAPYPLVTGEAGIKGNFSVVLTSRPIANVEFKLSSNLPTEGQLGVTSILFNSSNWNIPQTITVTGIDDSLTDGDVAYAIVTGEVVSSDASYAGMNAPDIAAVNRDDDIPDFIFNLPTSMQTTESGGAAKFTIALLIKPIANVSLRLSSSDMSEGVVSPAAITFTTVNWNTPQMVTVTGVNDLDVDKAVDYDVVVDASFSIDANYRKLVPRRIQVTNIDDENSTQPQAGEPSSIIIAPRLNLLTSEDGGIATFTVKLSRAPSNSVDIPIRSGNTAEGRVQPSNLVFDATNWSVPQTVTVVGRDDDVVDGHKNYAVIVESPLSDDMGYSSLSQVSVTITNKDNDRADVASAGGALGPWMLLMWLGIAVCRGRRATR